MPIVTNAEYHLCLVPLVLSVVVLNVVIVMLGVMAPYSTQHNSKKARHSKTTLRILRFSINNTQQNKNNPSIMFAGQSKFLL
jgi:hypothetical protein